MKQQKSNAASSMDRLALEKNPSAHSVLDRPSWRDLKMFPRLAAPGSDRWSAPSGLANDFEKWYGGWTWSWGDNVKVGSGTVEGPRAAVIEGNPKPHSASISTPNARRAFLTSISIPPQISTSFPSSPSKHSAISSTPALASSSPPTLILSSENLTLPSSLPLFTTEYFEARKSEKGGIGAFATKDIADSTVIMIEAPLFKATFMEVFVELEKLTYQQLKDYRTLHCFRNMSPVRDLAIYKTNRFETCHGKGGIFLLSSRFNHACHPYATCRYSYNQTSNNLIVTACKPIKKGEEITISYTTSPSQLPDNYGFYCDCLGCPPPKEGKKIAKFFRGPDA